MKAEFKPDLGTLHFTMGAEDLTDFTDWCRIHRAAWFVGGIKSTEMVPTNQDGLSFSVHLAAPTAKTDLSGLEARYRNALAVEGIVTRYGLTKAIRTRRLNKVTNIGPAGIRAILEWLVESSH